MLLCVCKIQKQAGRTDEARGRHASDMAVRLYDNRQSVCRINMIRQSS
uniref:Uncharacterized protein n=1 Tax=Myoviridae sp. ctu6J18 TaxID=2827714 RepID=A0A8S5TMY9_9CAUD|nr:MAG TPA: hypothetical protein [Myoviridae sp. ctu6J18]